jgi:GNAT superfamily N-acetyltransferase
LIKIRTPLASEKTLWLPLWEEYCGGEVSAKTTALTWRCFQDPEEPVHLLCAYQDKKMIGFATFVFHRSTWAESCYCYLEDLFVAKPFRRRGVAQQLIESVRKQAKKSKAERLYWATQQKNRVAQALYEKLAERTDLIQYRIKLL